MNRIPAKDVTKLALKVLRREFPNVKFSGTTNNNSCRIAWTDGPPAVKVRELVGHMCGSWFDMMTDMKESLYNEYGNDYLFLNHSTSFAAYAKALVEVMAMPYGVYIREIDGYVPFDGCRLIDNEYGAYIDGTQLQRDWGLTALDRHIMSSS